VRDSRVANTRSGEPSRSHLQFCTRAPTLLSLSLCLRRALVHSLCSLDFCIKSRVCWFAGRARATPERVVLKGGFASPARLEWCLTREDAWSALSPHVPWPKKIPPPSTSSRVICTPECTSTPLALCPPSSCIQICSRAHTHPPL
jgi:hypothetical protein